MELGKHKVGTLNYKLSDNEGNQLDESTDSSFLYLHGENNIIPGLEKALEGKQSGDKLNVEVAPQDAYGERSEELVQTVPKNIFPDDADVIEGMQFHAQSTNGEPMILTIKSVEKDEVVIDSNHPMAGMTLHFDVEIVDVREATEAEIELGHVGNGDNP